MQMPRAVLWSALVCSAFTAEAAVTPPVVLATLPFDEQYMLSSSAAPSTGITVQFAYSLVPGGLADIGTLVFDQRVFTTADAGVSVLLADANDDPQLPAFLARVTNGVDDDLRNDAIGDAGGGVGLVAPESVRLVPSVSLAGPDLAGYQVSAIELFIAELTLDPLAGSSVPHWQVRGELRFLGAPAPVPLPGALLPFTFAALTAGALRRRAA